MGDCLRTGKPSRYITKLMLLWFHIFRGCLFLVRFYGGEGDSIFSSVERAGRLAAHCWTPARRKLRGQATEQEAMDETDSHSAD